MYLYAPILQARKEKGQLLCPSSRHPTTSNVQPTHPSHSAQFSPPLTISYPATVRSDTTKVVSWCSPLLSWGFWDGWTLSSAVTTQTLQIRKLPIASVEVRSRVMVRVCFHRSQLQAPTVDCNLPVLPVGLWANMLYKPKRQLAVHSRYIKNTAWISL